MGTGMHVEHFGHTGGAAVITLTVHALVVVVTDGGGVGNCPGEQVVAPITMQPAISQRIPLPIRLVETVVVDVQLGTWLRTNLKTVRSLGAARSCREC